jgi:hypothetical protein
MTSREVFIVITEDRHTDVEVDVFGDEQSAITHAKKIANEHCRHEEDYEEQKIEGWIFSAIYSCEGDCVRVEKKPIKESKILERKSHE